MADQRKRGRAAGAFAEARTGLLRFTLLFGSLIAALSLIVVPAVDHRSREMVAERDMGVDDMTTGSIGAAPAENGPKRYTMRRSVLDDAAVEPCLMFPDGTQKGGC